MLLLTLKFFKHLHCVLENNTLHVLEKDKLFEWSPVQQLCLMAPALPLAFATPGDDTTHTLQIWRPSASCAELVNLESKENTMRGEASSGVALCLKESVFLLYGREKRPVLKIREMSSKTRKLSSSMTSTGK